jgi:hypothetical protein
MTDGTGVTEWALATCSPDQKAGDFYGNTYGDQSIRKVSLPALLAHHLMISSVDYPHESRLAHLNCRYANAQRPPG